MPPRELLENIIIDLTLRSALDEVDSRIREWGGICRLTVPYRIQKSYGMADRTSTLARNVTRMMKRRTIR